LAAGSADKTTDDLKSQLQRKAVNKIASCNQFQNDLGSPNGGIAHLLIERVGKNATPAWWLRECFFTDTLILSHILSIFFLKLLGLPSQYRYKQKWVRGEIKYLLDVE
jgi:hypothetical protein